MKGLFPERGPEARRVCCEMSKAPENRLANWRRTEKDKVHHFNTLGDFPHRP